MLRMNKLSCYIERHRLNPESGPAPPRLSQPSLWVSCIPATFLTKASGTFQCQHILGNTISAGNKLNNEHGEAHMCEIMCWTAAEVQMLSSSGKLSQGSWTKGRRLLSKECFHTLNTYTTVRKDKFIKIFQSARQFDNTQTTIKVIQTTESQLLRKMTWLND